MDLSIKYFEILKEFTSQFKNEEQNIPIDPFFDYLQIKNDGSIIYDVNHESTDFFKQKSVCLDNLPFFDPSHIFFLDALGEGGFGQVQKAYDTKQNEFIAIKTFKNNNSGKIKQINNEDNLLQKIEEIRTSGPKFKECFLKYYGVYKFNNNLILKLENGCASLANILESGKVFSLPELVYVHRRLVEVLAILEENGIANRDIKPDNIIIVEDQKEENNYFYKLSDFGIGCRFLSNSTKLIPMKTISGFSKPYAAPELEKIIKKKNQSLIEDNKYNPFKADVYSLGILTLKMINYKWGKKDLKNGLLSQKENFQGYEVLIPMLDGMLKKDAEERWDFQTIKKFYESKYDNLEGNLVKIKDKEMIPMNITKFYHDWLVNIKERGKDLGTLVEEHWKLYGAYKENVTRPKEAKFHLKNTYIVLKKIETKINDNEEQKKNSKIELDILESNLKERIIFCFLGYGDYYILKGKLKRSKEYFDKASEIINVMRLKEQLEENTTENNVEYLESLVYNGLGLYYERLGDLQKTEEFFVKSMIIKFKVLAENNSEFAMSLNNLAGLYKNVGKLKKAENLFLKSMNICIEIYGETHHYVANAMNNLAELYDYLGNFKKALDFCNKSLKIRREIFGQKHAEVAISMNNLAMQHVNLGNFEKAEELLLESLDILMEIFGENHPSVAITTNNLAFFYQTRKNFQKSIEFYLKSLRVSKKIYGDNHYNVAATLNNIAHLFKQLRKYEESEKSFRKSLEITINLFGEKNHDVAMTMNNLALLYEDVGNFNYAEAYHQKSIIILVDIFGEKNAKVAISMLNLAELYEKLGNVLKSKELNLKSMNISMNLFGENHNNVFRAMNNLGIVYEKLGANEKSEKFFYKSLEINDNLKEI